MKKDISYVYLNKERNYPPIDNQGKIRSCVSQAISYIQLTNAVSKKIGLSVWTPSSMPMACFSPRFTHLKTSSIPSDIYNFLKDHGCLTTDVCAFQKDSGGGSVEFDGGVPIKESVAWNVAPGEFKRALQTRITGYTMASIHDYEPKELIELIKTSLQEGNVVVSTTKIENWLQMGLSHDCGKHGKKGDTVVVASRRYIPYGHSFAIVGYDDDIEVTFAGITFKGAFLITCGYGTVWMNQGYCWMLYDAIFETSQYELMNSRNIYSDNMFLTSYYGNLRVFAPSHLSDKMHEVQEFEFIPAGKLKIEGAYFPTYQIRNPNSKKYLTLIAEMDSEYYNPEFSGSKDTSDTWCIVPYREIVKWKDFEAEYDPFYEDAYWIFSSEQYQKDPSSRCFLDSGLGYFNIGRIMGISRLNHGNYTHAKSWKLENYDPDKFAPFVSKFGIYAKDEKISKRRTYSLRDFWFVDWKKDVALGLPELMVDLELETVDRESFEIKMLRYDKEGNIDSYIPAMFRVGHTQYVVEPDVMSFSGEINAKKPETGYFTFQYSDLLSIPKGTILEDYRWGIEVTSKNEQPVTIKSVSLVNAKNEILASIDMESGPLLICNNSKKFIF